MSDKDLCRLLCKYDKKFIQLFYCTGNSFAVPSFRKAAGTVCCHIHPFPSFMVKPSFIFRAVTSPVSV